MFFYHLYPQYFVHIFCSPSCDCGWSLQILFQVNLFALPLVSTYHLSIQRHCFNNSLHSTWIICDLFLKQFLSAFEYAEIAPILKKKNYLILIFPSSHHLNFLFPFEGSFWKEFLIPIVPNFSLLILPLTYSNSTFVPVIWPIFFSRSSKLLNLWSTLRSHFTSLIGSI